VIQDFVNTFEVEDSRDELGSPDELGAWLADRRLLGVDRSESVTAADMSAAIELREALRRLLIANNGGHGSASDFAVLDGVALRAGLRPRFGLAPAGVALEPAAGGVTAALGRLVALVAGAMNEGSWGRLKACAEDTCQWVFYDRTKNRSGHWCQMRVCGNRSKARQFRQRRRRAGLDRISG
jgi:predicted RNA-binding Zn ribbon-like protein